MCTLTFNMINNYRYSPRGRKKHDWRPWRLWWSRRNWWWNTSNGVFEQLIFSQKSNFCQKRQTFGEKSKLFANNGNVYNCIYYFNTLNKSDSNTGGDDDCSDVD